MAHMLMSLRAVNHRLTNLPVEKLPQVAASLAASLTECGELLSAPQSQRTNKGDSETAVQIHKLVTRLTSLLQDRTCEGRWTAVVLVKALVEAGQWEMLRGSEPFVRGLMSILNKSDPVTTKVMAVIALTRIFHLTYQYPTLVREITTPSLPGFITSTLNLISVKPSSEPTRRLKPHTPFLEVVLHAHAELIARHPTIFRPFTSQIHSILQAIVGSTSPSFPQPVVEVAEQLFIALHTCAPKNTGGEEWKNACRMTITSIHTTSNHVLRAIVEQWESVDPELRQQVLHPGDYAREMGNAEVDPLGLCGWQGLDSGVRRLVILLRMLSAFLSTATASTVAIPVGSILDLTTRLMSVTVPSDASNVQANPQISRTEREHLFAELPRIHSATAKVLQTLVNTLGTGVVPVAQTILEQTLWVFRAEKFSREVRASVYDLIQALVAHVGQSMTKKNVSSLADILRTCCLDLLPPERDAKEASSDSKGKSKTNPGAVNADFFLNPNLKQGRQTNTSSNFPILTEAASDLLPVVLSYLPTEFISPPLRAEIDSTIIMTSDKKAMFASVLNPLPAVKGRGANVSIMPFLARSYASDLEVEGLIRPRMPVLTNANSIGQYNTLEDDEEEDEPMSTTPAPHVALNTSGFLKPSSTPNLHQDLMDVDAPQQQPTPISNKRHYAEESDAARTHVPTGVAENVTEAAQGKKARFDGNILASARDPTSPDSATSARTSAASALVSTAPDKTTVAVQTLSAKKGVSMPSASAAPTVGQVGSVNAALSEGDGSDDEMPSLNIDPDTDSEAEEDE
ncbi:hypothetical protein P175DRAFT_0471169 [Aspergillus ochraceoroseus IBT 24754]|uniref:Pre-rRNA-processing protein RIX1 n=2 Tax=Aspergillus ochraceoroseus TaxID=138278 RepID=A0A2T5M875_9EURO|nr:uncharacterized protein P175DRAFT_0471169 [Aspergillus ochraceoroseus IBT 24754]PTU24740.1 hypothetical protein P175DRAFT_0471169 [Aspergillus ochraceoroseus IBT 24754]